MPDDSDDFIKMNEPQRLEVFKSRLSTSNSFFFTDLNLKSEDNEFYIEGIASSINEDLGNDTLTENCLYQMAEIINTKNVKLGFDHTELLGGRPTLEAVGKLVQAQVQNGRLWVKGILDKTFSHFEEVKHKIKNKFLDGLSIEYQVDPNRTIENYRGNSRYRVIDGLKTLIGVALTPRPMNPDALFDYYLKHVPEIKKETVEEKQMTQEPAQPTVEVKSEVEVKKEEQTEVKGIDFEKIGKETYAKQQAEKQATEFKQLAMEALKSELKTLREKEPYINPQAKFESSDKAPFDAELKHWRETIQSETKSLNAKYNAAAKLHTALEKYGINERGSMSSGSRGWKQNAITIGGENMNKFQLKSFEYKAQLEHDTNKVSDADYYQNAAELNDVYGPVILDHLNQKTTYYGLLPKKDVSMIGSDKYGFKIRTGRIAGVGGDTSTYNYDEAATLTGQNATKIKVQQPFMQYGVVLQVSGLTIAEGRGSIGDVFAKEVSLGTADLLKGMNVDLLGTAVGFTDGGKVTGLQVFGEDGTTYTSLYGHARATYTTLQGNLRAQTGSPNVDKVLLRQIIRDCEIDGGDRNQLAFVCHPIQRDKILGLLDLAQRFNSTSARAGFEGLPMFDGVPIYSDVDATTTVIHAVPMDKTYLAVLQPPTFEDLAKTDDSKKGFVKTYFCHVMEQPNHGGIITGLSAS